MGHTAYLRWSCSALPPLLGTQSATSDPMGDGVLVVAVGMGGDGGLSIAQLTPLHLGSSLWLAGMHRQLEEE
jgi:hypothetical protein